MKYSFLSVLLSGLTLLVLAGATDAQNPTTLWETKKGIQKPESVYYHKKSDRLFVSNIVGGGTEKDGKGWISVLSAEGEVLEPKWVKGLNAPKGIRIADGTLWVSDIDRLLGFDLSTGKNVEEVSIPDAVFLNDVAVGHDGDVFVSDMRDNKIYRYSDGEVGVFAQGEKLESPNGLLVSGTRLLVGGNSTGENKSGHLFSIDLRTGKKRLITPEPTLQIDGIELDGRGNYIVTEWSRGTILKISPDGTKKKLLQLERSTADIGFDQKTQRLFLPYMLKNKVVAYRIAPKRSYQSLIDDRLSLWQTQGNWNVNQDGVVTLKPGPDEEGWKRFEDYLTSKAQYKDFELHVEYKFQEGGNSGVFFHIGNPKKPVSTGIEVQILDSFHESGELGPHDHGGIISATGPAINMSRPAGHWQHMVVLSNGDHLRVLLNGEQIQDVQLNETNVSDRPSTGHISIQDHGLPFQVRSIRIRPLQN